MHFLTSNNSFVVKPWINGIKLKMKRKGKKSLSTWNFSVRAASEGSTPKASDGDVSVILAPIYSLRSFHVTGMPKCLSTYALIEGIEHVPQCAFRTTAIWIWNNKSTQGLPVCRDPSKPVMKRLFFVFDCSFLCSSSSSCYHQAPWQNSAEWANFQN